MKREPAVTIEACAIALARLQYFPADAGESILADLGVLPEEWATARDAWLEALGKEAALERSDLSDRFGKAFADERRRLRTERPALEAVLTPVEAVIDAADDAAPATVSKPKWWEMPAEESLDATAFPVQRDEPTLPFVKRLEPTPEFLAQMEAWGQEWESIPSRDGATVPMPEPPHSHDPTVGWNTKLLTAEQYATLCAELEVFPERREQAYARQGIGSPEEGERVHRLFAIRFSVDTELKARVEELIAVYARWMRDNRG